MDVFSKDTQHLIKENGLEVAEKSDCFKRDLENLVGKYVESDANGWKKFFKVKGIDADTLRMYVIGVSTFAGRLIILSGYSLSIYELSNLKVIEKSLFDLEMKKSLIAFEKSIEE